METQENFPEVSAWPEWLEERRCPDELFAQAYDTLPESFRGALKTAIALSFFHFGQNDAKSASTLENRVKGFCRHFTSRPAPWALTVFDENFHAPARLLAACILPALCGVPLLGACCLGQRPAPENLLALELCGVEDTFCLDDRLMQVLISEMGAGRLVLLHGGDLGRIAYAAAVFNLPCIAEQLPPRLFVADPEAFDLETLSIAQGTSASALTSRPEGRIDAIYLQNPASRDPVDYGDSPLALGPGLEAFWLWADLAPDFFRVRNLAFNAIFNNQ